MGGAPPLFPIFIFTAVPPALPNFRNLLYKQGREKAESDALLNAEE